MKEKVMQEKKINFILVLTIILFLLLAPVAIAPCPDPDNPSYCYDSNFPENFDWSNGDYSSLNWENIDYTRIDFTRVPAEFAWKVDVNRAITAGRGTEVTQQILEAHLDQETLDGVPLESLNKEYLTPAIKNKLGFTLSSLKSGAVFEKGVLRAKAGSFDIAGKNDWEISVEENGEIHVFQPRGIDLQAIDIDENTITSQDTFVVGITATFTTRQGEKHSIRGLRFKEGTAYVKATEEAQVGEYLIQGIGKDVEVFFQPEPSRKENAVIMTKTTLDIISSKESSISLKGLPRNKLFWMVKKDHSTDPPILVPSEQDILKITVSGGDRLSTVSRDSEGKTPKITHHDGGGETNIVSGRIKLDIRQGKLMVTPPTPLKENRQFFLNSVAFELFSDEKKFYPLRTSSSNRFRYQSARYGIVSNSMGMPVSDSIEKNMMKTPMDLEKKYVSIRFWAKGYQASANSVQVVDEWFETKPGIHKYFDDFIFTPTKGAGASGPVDSTASERMFIDMGELILDLPSAYTYKIRMTSSPLVVLDHEFTHVLDAYIALSEKSRPIAEEVITVETLLQKYWLAKTAVSSRAVEKAKMDPIMSSLLIRTGQNKEEESRILKEREQRFVELTGFDDHTLNAPAEIPAGYSELDGNLAKEYPELAQLEFDRANSLGIKPGDPDEWIVKKAEERYYTILGGENGAYCKNNPCGPCIIYTLTCTPQSPVIKSSK